MELDYQIREFEPVDICPPFDNLDDILLNLIEKPDMVQPVRAISGETHQPISSFFMSLVMEGEDIFVQLEGFSSKDYEKTIIQSFPNPERWTIVQPGIVRLKILF
jgi:hypothetical protein